MKKKKIFIIIAIIVIALILLITITKEIVGEHGNNKKVDRDLHDIIRLILIDNISTSNFKTRIASKPTKRVGGLIPYNVRSDLIIEIPEEYFLRLDSTMTYDELISKIGEPSGTVGSGIVRDYWRISEDKYAICTFWGNGMHFDIWEGNQ